LKLENGSSSREHGLARRFNIGTLAARCVAAASIGLALACLPAQAGEATKTNRTTSTNAPCSGIGFVWWNELISEDTDRLGSFYAKVVGWKTKIIDVEEQRAPASKPENRYTVFVKGLRESTGLMDIEHPNAASTKPGWFVYIQVADTDAAARAATSNGGAVLYQPKTQPDGNRIAVIKDPKGNVFGLVTPKQARNCPAG
jgi:predicted enzyme related to lactoylglutathione lyase